ncbi:hypothetical protein [Tenacibaculum sp. SG-28]|uniref:hypothetical protein n=1 Tax=Tenacibaculum sp. SG-28 TaxID=754426 RepID=UPI000CF40102|nr:hypothetical protein [Tenacibaculum sp. SG-28]PQJ22882.1 hypothetical protein BSU00_00855 [Tenacibaculum sp. SG-28]
MKKLWFITLFLVACITHDVSAQDKDENWFVITSKTASYKAETDKIDLWSKSQNLDKIKFRCTQGTLKIKKVRVFLSDGTSKEFKPKGTGVLTKGMSSYPFSIPKGDVKVKKIEIDYDSVGNMVVTKRGKVDVMGKKRTK